MGVKTTQVLSELYQQLPRESEDRIYIEGRREREDESICVGVKEGVKRSE